MAAFGDPEREDRLLAAVVQAYADRVTLAPGGPEARAVLARIAAPSW